MKKSSVYSLGLRIKMLCCEETSLTNLMKDLTGLKLQLRRVENRTRNELLYTNSCVGKEVGIPLIVPYHPPLMV